MANRHRGDVPLELDGRRFTLRLTLGALAELEDALGSGDLNGLGERLSAGRLSARDIIAILEIALRGGGHDPAPGDVRAMAMTAGLAPVVAAIATLFTATFGDTSEPEAPPRPPPP
jgi:Phage tail tube protein, GTA-gp10